MKIRDENEFREELNANLDFLEDEFEDELEVPIKIVSVGPDRKQTIYRHQTEN